MSKPNRHERRRRRAQRMLEWNAARVAFILSGGHESWVVPFNLNWRADMQAMTANLEQGGTYYSQPRNYHGNLINTGRPPRNFRSWPGLSSSWLEESAAVEATYRK